MGYIVVFFLTHLLTFDPNFQRDILGHGGLFAVFGHPRENHQEIHGLKHPRGETPPQTYSSFAY